MCRPYGAFLRFQQEVEVGVEGEFFGVLHLGLEDFHLVGLADEGEFTVLEQQGRGFADGGDGSLGVDHDIFFQTVVAGLAAVLRVEEVGVVGVDLEGHQTHAVERGRHDDGHVVGGAERGACHVAAA